MHTVPVRNSNLWIDTLHMNIAIVDYSIVNPTVHLYITNISRARTKTFEQND